MKTSIFTGVYGRELWGVEVPAVASFCKYTIPRRPFEAEPPSLSSSLTLSHRFLTISPPGQVNVHSDRRVSLSTKIPAAGEEADIHETLLVCRVSRHVPTVGPHRLALDSCSTPGLFQESIHFTSIPVERCPEAVVERNPVGHR